MNIHKLTHAFLIASLVLSPLHGHTQAPAQNDSYETLVGAASRLVTASSELTEVRMKAEALAKLLEVRDSKHAELYRLTRTAGNIEQIHTIKETLAGLDMAVTKIVANRVPGVYLSELRKRQAELEALIQADQSTLSSGPEGEKVRKTMDRVQELVALETNLKAQEEAYRALRNEAIEFNRKAPSQKAMSLAVFAAATAAAVLVARGALNPRSYPAPDESMIMFGAPLGLAMAAGLVIAGIEYTYTTFEYVGTKRADFTALLERAHEEKLAALTTVSAFKKALLLQLSEK
ncbi:MAG TPA: hypothetical protein VFV50_02470 [Bdellovibrionales bacterium]|nr:hypothetical protein [Bdellovibrionales bacterium]